MIVSPLKKDNGTTQLLTFIGMQIGESVAQYFSKDHETPNGSINHGVKNYKILPHHLFENVFHTNVYQEGFQDVVDKKIQELNDMLSEFDIQIGIDYSSDLRYMFSVKIFP